MPNNGVSFSVVIPMYNERAGCESCIHRVHAELAKDSHHHKLIIVNDGSIDGTAEILEELSRQMQDMTVITHPSNQGYGSALLTGVRQSIKEGLSYVLFMDSDLTNDPADIPRFVEKMEQGIDVIKASRFIRGGGMTGVHMSREIISRTGNMIARVLFRANLHDCTNGFRAVRTHILNQMSLKEKGFAIIVEELYNCVIYGASFCEIPVVLTNRAGDLRTTSFSYKPSTFWKYLKYGLRAFFRIQPDTV